ncbi:MAG TPA: hypothetical protein VGM76_13675 [Lacipirellulaceae bacterium]
MLSMTPAAPPSALASDGLPNADLEIEVVSVTTTLIVPPLPPDVGASADPEAMQNNSAAQPPQTYGWSDPPPARLSLGLPEDSLRSMPLPQAPVHMTEVMFFANPRSAELYQDEFESSGYFAPMREVMHSGGIGLYSLDVYPANSARPVLLTSGDVGYASPRLRPEYSGPDRDAFSKYSHDVPPVDLPSPASGASEQNGSAANAEHPYDVVMQSYSTQAAPLILDQGALNGVSSYMLTDKGLTSDESQGGFATLDSVSRLGGDATARADADMWSDAIDAALADLHVLDLSAGNDAAGDTTDGSSSSSLAESQADVGESVEGGMVVLSPATTGPDLALAASPSDAPTNWNVPDGKVQMEASVGVYQAFDVASSELSSTISIAPAAVAVPSAAHEQRAAKNSVSADKAAKPVADQASAWVELVTAGAVIGAAKKQRQKRTKS